MAHAQTAHVISIVRLVDNVMLRRAAAEAAKKTPPAKRRRS
jgi:hypothetical protein